MSGLVGCTRVVGAAADVVVLVPGNIVVDGDIVGDDGVTAVVDDGGTAVDDDGGSVVDDDFVDDVPACFVVVGIIVIGDNVVVVAVLFVPSVVGAVVTGRNVVAARVVLPSGTLFVVVRTVLGISHFCETPFRV